MKGTIVSNSITCESLREPCLELFEQLKGGVTPERATRLTCNGVVQPHGTNRNVLLWRVWDPRLRKLGYDQRFACIRFHYDPTHWENREFVWCLQLYFNKRCAYRHSEAIQKLMLQRASASCPLGFERFADERRVQLAWYFNHAGSPEALVPLVLPKLVLLTEAVGPIFDEMVEISSRPASEAEHTLLAAIQKLSRGLASPNPKLGGGAIFNRGISPVLRAKVIAKSGNACGICRQPLSGEVHIDHIVPVARGGLTELGNLQATHADCNLSKGKGRA